MVSHLKNLKSGEAKWEEHKFVGPTDGGMLVSLTVLNTKGEQRQRHKHTPRTHHAQGLSEMAQRHD